MITLSFAFALPCAAEEAVPRAAIDADVLSYYGGEETSAWVVLGLSVACVGSGAPLVAQKSDFDRGLGVPLLSLGVLEGIGAGFYVGQVRAETRHYRELLASDPEGFRKEERAHIEGTQARFVYYRATELALTLAGIGFTSYGLVANRDLEKGLGVGLFAVGFPFLVIDTINNGRASRYHDNLVRFDPSLALQKDPHGTHLAFSARF
jgi:hypothetical protein